MKRQHPGIVISATRRWRLVVVCVGVAVFLMGLALFRESGSRDTYAPLAILIGLFWTALGARMRTSHT
jgi:predicted Na+-dependent transporter